MHRSLGLPGAADGRVVARPAALAILSGLLALPVALPASIGRGYLPAVGGLMVLVVAAQVAMVAGAGTWWPWSVAAVWAMGTDAGMDSVPPVGTRFAADRSAGGAGARVGVPPTVPHALAASRGRRALTDLDPEPDTGKVDAGRRGLC